MTYYNEVMADWTDNDDDSECEYEVEGRNVGWILRKRADEEQKYLRTECKTLQSGNQALRETAEMLSREVEDTYKDLEATEVERDGIQRKLREQSTKSRALQEELDEAEAQRGNQRIELAEQEKSLQQSHAKLRVTEEREAHLGEQLKKAKDIIIKQ